ncbi:biosynthetic-type acetolactate synthase large subunit [bacterium]|nr:biosynthetic-type acetolactate synthase large subunit [bacterium]
MRMTAAKALVECMKREGVEVIFGYPGGAVLPLYDVLYEEKEIRHILVRHEQGAAHAADGYARATGKVGVCIATSGPGATNLVTGITTAYMDSSPIVAITGQVRSDILGKDSFQEADISGITMPITKHNYLVKDPDLLPYIVKEAFYIAKTGRPGPVLIDLPVDVQSAEIDYQPIEKVSLRSYRPTYEGHPGQILKAAQAIAEAQKPVLLVGGGCINSGASEEVVALAEKCQIPVVHSLMGKGTIPEEHPLSLGLLGMHGTVAANLAVSECDLLIAVGARFSDRSTGKVSTFATMAQVIHIDIDPAEIGKNVQVNIPIVGDAKRVLQQLVQKVEPKSHPLWLERVNDWKQKYPLKYKEEGEVIKPQKVVETIWKLTNGEAVIVTEVGQNQMWAAQFYKTKYPRQFITSGGLGTMGFGLPAAIGVQIARPDAIVFDIAGDGSIQMNIQELATAVQQRLPIKIAILNNGYLGMVRQWQELFWNRRYSFTQITAPDFVKLADAYGCVGIRVTRTSEIEDAIRKALEVKDRPCIIDFIIAPEEKVLPMVPAGGSIDKMLVD